MARLRLLVLLLALPLAGWSLHTPLAELAAFAVEAQEGDLVLRWETEREVEVASFRVERRTAFSNGAFNALATLPAHGPRLPYEYRDEQLYKSGTKHVDYQLVVVFADATEQILREERVNYTATFVRRTWGSLKAMFQ